MTFANRDLVSFWLGGLGSSPGWIANRRKKGEDRGRSAINGWQRGEVLALGPSSSLVRRSCAAATDEQVREGSKTRYRDRHAVCTESKDKDVQDVVAGEAWAEVREC